MDPTNTDHISSTKPGALDLDPGISNVAKRKQLRVTFSVGRCCIWTSFTVTTLIIFAVAGLVALPMMGKGHPHRKYLADAKISVENEPNRVVKPLVDNSTKFDIAATVFIRDAQEAPHHEDGRFKEIPLFSDVVFQDRQFGDKEQTAVVNLSIPLDVFQQETLFNYDVRASFVLIPKAPSPLDRLKKHTSWTKQWAIDHKATPRRSWPFPLSQHEDDNADLEGLPSSLDLAIDQIGVTVPLIRFFDISGSCEGADSSRSRTSNNTSQWNMDHRNGRLVSTHGHATLDRHPFFIAKTHLRVVEDTELYRKDKFIDVQSSLRHRCKVSANGDAGAEYHHCNRQFRTNGVFETLFELDAVESKGDASEWAYGPFLTTIRAATGPKDLVPLPVQRGTCRPRLGEKVPVDVFPQSIDVRWRISFLPVSPRNQVGVETLDDTLHRTFNHSHGDWSQAGQQDWVDMLNALTGHSHAEETHAWRKLVVFVLRALIWIPGPFLLLDYWYTRRSTYGIGISASFYVALSTATDAVKQSWHGALTFLICILTFACAILMLRKVIPVRLRVSKQSGSLELSLAIAEPTRRERYSQRRDLNWKAYGVLYLSLVLLYKIANPRNIILSPSAFPTPKVAIPPTTSLVLTCLTMLVAPVHTYCMLSQCILSQRLRVFAGQHKLGLVLTVASFFLRYVEYMEGIFGKTRVKERLTLHSVFTGAMLLVGIYQMWVFPSVDQDADDEKE